MCFPPGTAQWTWESRAIRQQCGVHNAFRRTHGPERSGHRAQWAQRWIGGHHAPPIAAVRLPAAVLSTTLPPLHAESPPATGKSCPPPQPPFALVGFPPRLLATVIQISVPGYLQNHGALEYLGTDPYGQPLSSLHHAPLHHYNQLAGLRSTQDQLGIHRTHREAELQGHVVSTLNTKNI